MYGSSPVKVHKNLKAGTEVDISGIAGTAYLAHIANINGVRTEQTIRTHSLNTAKYASESLEHIGLYHTAYLTGLIHDMGKLTKKFMQYLEDSFNGKPVAKGSVNHTFAAVIYLFEKFYSKSLMSSLTCEIISFAAGSHHGEFDCVDADSISGFEHRIDKDRPELCYEEAKNNYFLECADETEIERLFNLATGEITGIYSKIITDFDRGAVKVSFLAGMLARLLLSALIDADRRDTAEFMGGINLAENKAARSLWQKQLDYLKNKISGFNTDTPINLARKYISDQCECFAKRGGGIYKITVPTGAGKTLSTLRYALAHAAEHNKSRVIFIIPLLSVLEQNSKVIREYIADENIITEHHSNIVKAHSYGEEIDNYELLSETWNSPIIISTLVQLLNMLFSDKTTAIRRMRALVNSVIVIDEIQSLPRNITYMFNMAINFLVYYCNATVILSSATQPCFEETEMPLKLSESPEMISLSDKYNNVFNRTKIIDKTSPYGMNIDELADFSAELIYSHSSLLIICNTKAAAAKLFSTLKMQNSSDKYKLFHLSTSMCMQHRINTLDKVNACLKNGVKVVCVATQLVEAGVDFSFEVVVRSKAGMDNIAQAAGRCNRNSEYSYLCSVYIVNLRDENLDMLKEIKVSQDCITDLLLKYSAEPQKYDYDLLSEKSIREYYRLLYGRIDTKNQFKYPVKLTHDITEDIFNLLSVNKNFIKRPQYRGRYFLNQSFKTAGRLFKVFDDNTTDIIVPYNGEANDIINDLCSSKANFDYAYLKGVIDKAKPYTVQIYEHQKKLLEEQGMLHWDNDRHFIALKSEQCYDSETGLKADSRIY